MQKQGLDVEALEVLKSIAQKLTINDVISENVLNEEAKNELTKIKEIQKTVDRENLYYRTNKYISDLSNNKHFW